MPASHSHGRTTSFVAALRAESLTVTMVVDEAITGQPFQDYVRQRLVPILRPGDMALKENISSRMRAVVREALETAGANRLYARPYRPYPNLTAQSFANHEALLRKAGERTFQGL